MDQALKEKNDFVNGVIAMEQEKCKRNLNTPIYIWATILELSKVLIQDFHYNCIKDKYGAKAEMLLTYTVSLT